MRNFIVTYDLKRPGKDYPNLIAAIKAQSYWAHVQGSVWYIKSRHHNCASLRDALARHIDANDSLFVAEMSDAAWIGLSQEVSNGIQAWWKAAA